MILSDSLETGYLSQAQRNVIEKSFKKKVME